MPSIAAFDANLPLESAPIDPTWITQGKPESRNRVLSVASDGSAWTMLWACTPGSFRWRYSFDETIHFLEGAVTITGSDGVERHFGPGDMIFFPAGSVADWQIDRPVKKLAFCHIPAPWLLRLPLNLLRRLGRLARGAWRLVKPHLSDAGLTEARQEGGPASALCGTEKNGVGTDPVC